MSRFATITDAAIALVADLGMRGLTHRAVDARAGLPVGTTSAYYRTRRALIEALVRRLAELDTADLEGVDATGGPLDVRALDGRTLTATDVDAVAVGVAHVVDLWLTAGRTRTLARYACLLEATHHEELRGILAYGAVPRDHATRLLRAAGADDPRTAGTHFVACVDGLLFDRLIGAGALASPPPGTEENRRDLALAVRSVLRGLTGR